MEDCTHPHQAVGTFIDRGISSMPSSRNRSQQKQPSRKAKTRSRRKSPQRPRSPECGHSVCSNYYIETGSRECIEAESRRLGWLAL